MQWSGVACHVDLSIKNSSDSMTINNSSFTSVIQGEILKIDVLANSSKSIFLNSVFINTDLRLELIEGGNLDVNISGSTEGSTFKKITSFNLFSQKNTVEISISKLLNDDDFKGEISLCIGIIY